jgi:hypothetical protein
VRFERVGSSWLCAGCMTQSAVWSPGWATSLCEWYAVSCDTLVQHLLHQSYAAVCSAACGTIFAMLHYMLQIDVVST